MRSSGEEFLKDLGLVRARSPARRQVLGCLACRWSNPDSEGAYGAQIATCTGRWPGTVVPILRRLEDVGVVTATPEDPALKDSGRPLRTYYEPAETKLGTAFAASLEVPTSCGLGEDALPETTASPEPSRPGRVEVVTEIMDACSRRELEQIIARAEWRIARWTSQ